MLLRASIPDPENLRTDYGVVIPPDDNVLSQAEAVGKIAEMRGPLIFSAERRGSELVVRATEPSLDEEPVLEWRAKTYSQVIKRMNPAKDPDAPLQVKGFREAMLVSASLVERWFRFAKCWACSLSLTEPTSASPRGVIAVLGLGREATGELESADTAARFKAVPIRADASQLRGRHAHTVDFRITELQPREGDFKGWLATVGSQPNVTQVEIWLSFAADSADRGDVTGVLHRHPPSNPSPLLSLLSEAHGVQPFALEVAPVDSVPIRGTLLGRNLERGRGAFAASFSRGALGTWFVVELSLLSDYPEHSRLVVALSPSTGQGAFVPVGAKQGPGVIAALYS